MATQPQERTNSMRLMELDLMRQEHEERIKFDKALTTYAEIKAHIEKQDEDLDSTVITLMKDLDFYIEQHAQAEAGYKLYNTEENEKRREIIQDARSHPYFDFVKKLINPLGILKTQPLATGLWFGGSALAAAAVFFGVIATTISISLPLLATVVIPVFPLVITGIALVYVGLAYRESYLEKAAKGNTNKDLKETEKLLKTRVEGGKKADKIINHADNMMLCEQKVIRFVNSLQQQPAVKALSTEPIHDKELLEKLRSPSNESTASTMSNLSDFSKESQSTLTMGGNEDSKQILEKLRATYAHKSNLGQVFPEEHADKRTTSEVFKYDGPKPEYNKTIEEIPTAVSGKPKGPTSNPPSYPPPPPPGTPPSKRKKNP